LYIVSYVLIVLLNIELVILILDFVYLYYLILLIYNLYKLHLKLRYQRCSRKLIRLLADVNFIELK